MRHLAAAAMAMVAASAAVPTAATAANLSYNVTTRFGGARFIYGSGSGATTFNQVATKSTNCFGSASLECYAVDAQSVPTVVHNTGTSPVNFAGTVTAPTNAILLHPGVASDSIVQFTASFASQYSISGLFERLDNTVGGGDGVVASIYRTVVGGASTLLFSTIIPAGAYGTSSSFDESVFLGVGDSLKFVVNRNGEYTYDSTGLQAVITAVPEASTWALMLVGFGMAGGAMRRRRREVAHAAHA